MHALFHAARRLFRMQGVGSNPYYGNVLWTSAPPVTYARADPRIRQTAHREPDAMSALEDWQAGNDATVLHWYDFICPFCYIGQQRTAVLVRAGFHVVELPFQIHPEIPPVGVPVGPRHGPLYAMLEQEAKEAGLGLFWPRRLPDTRRALAAAEWTRRHDQRAFPQLHRQLFEAHFVLGEDLGDPAVINSHAQACGVNLAALDAALTDGSAEAAVAEAETIGSELGIHATPAWLLPEGLITGLRPAMEFQRLALPPHVS